MKLRVRFTKVGKVRFTSHRDVARMWERALRRARLPIAYTAGFSPRPQLSFGLALPTCCESDAEYLDVAFSQSVDPAAVMDLGPMLPDGVDVTAAAELDPGTGSLQELVTTCSWEIAVPSVSPLVLADAVRTVLGAEHLPVERERKGRREADDLRPSIVDLRVAESQSDHAVLVAELGTRPRGVRPVELAGVMGTPFGLARRTHQWIERDGSRGEPLAVDAALAAAGRERAS